MAHRISSYRIRATDAGCSGMDIRRANEVLFVLFCAEPRAMRLRDIQRYVQRADTLPDVRTMLDQLSGASIIVGGAITGWKLKDRS